MQVVEKPVPSRNDETGLRWFKKANVHCTHLLPPLTGDDSVVLVHETSDCSTFHIDYLNIHTGQSKREQRYELYKEIPNSIGVDLFDPPYDNERRFDHPQDNARRREGKLPLFARMHFSPFTHIKNWSTSFTLLHSGALAVPSYRKETDTVGISLIYPLAAFDIFIALQKRSHSVDHNNCTVEELSNENLFIRLWHDHGYLSTYYLYDQMEQK
jgi:hypothetical protein